MNNASNAASRDPLSNRKTNRLVGWLVSYGMDAHGAAFEIREGRTLITAGKSEGDHTISIREETVSTPHAAINAVVRDNVVLVQDIFSDCGTFITRNGERDDVPVEGPIVLQHGDWLHIGETVRFQVCLIDGGR